MQKIRQGDGTDANGVAAHPFSAPLGQKFLIQRVSGAETSFGYVERLWLCFARVYVIHRRRVPVKEAHFVDTVEGILQLFIAVNAEIGRYQSEYIASLQIASQVVSDSMCAVIKNMSVCHDVAVLCGQFSEDRQLCAAATCWPPVYLSPGVENCFIVHHCAICFEIGGRAVAVGAGDVNRVFVNASRGEATAAYAHATTAESCG